MENSNRITDNEIIEAIKSIKSEEENCLANALIKLLYLNLDIRQFLRKIYKDKPKKVYSKPTGNKKDIIVGK